MVLPDKSLSLHPILWTLTYHDAPYLKPHNSSLLLLPWISNLLAPCRWPLMTWPSATVCRPPSDHTKWLTPPLPHKAHALHSLPLCRPTLLSRTPVTASSCKPRSLFTTKFKWRNLRRHHLNHVIKINSTDNGTPWDPQRTSDGFVPKMHKPNLIMRKHWTNPKWKIFYKTLTYILQKRQGQERQRKTGELSQTTRDWEPEN